jgi:hypothetical protein
LRLKAVVNRDYDKKHHTCCPAPLLLMEEKNGTRNLSEKT